MLVTVIPIVMAIAPTFLAGRSPSTACIVAVDRGTTPPRLPDDAKVDVKGMASRKPRVALTLVSGMVVGGQTLVAALTICGGSDRHGLPELTFVLEGAGSLGHWQVAAVWRRAVRDPSLDSAPGL